MEENRPEMGSIPAVQLSANSDKGLPVGRYLMDITFVIYILIYIYWG